MVGEDGYGGIIEIFYFEVAYTNKYESKEKNEFQISDFTKGILDTNRKNRKNEMEVKIKNVENRVSKCGSSTKSKTRNDKIMIFVAIYLATFSSLLF